LLWGAGFRADWNQAALEASALVITEGLNEIRDLIGHSRLWTLFQTAHDIDSSSLLSIFWKKLLPELRVQAVVYTSQRKWATANQAVVTDPRHEPWLEVIESLGFHPVHPDIAPYRNLLTSGAALGVRVLSLGIVIDALAELGLCDGANPVDGPPTIQLATLRLGLWDLLEQMLTAAQTTPSDRSGLREVACFPAADGTLWRATQLLRAEPETIDLFSKDAFDLTFAGISGTRPQLEALIPDFDSELALDALEAVDDAFWTNTSNEWKLQLLRWFSERSEELSGSASRSRVASLPIFPSASGFAPLKRLSLPGFADPMGLAALVDLSAVSDLEHFLNHLGAKALTFQEYVVRHVIPMARQNNLSSETRKRLVSLLVTKFGEIGDNNEIRLELASVPIVSCAGAVWAKASEAYFEGDHLELVPASRRLAALIPRDHQHTFEQFLTWLGVAKEPRWNDLIDSARVVAEGVPTSQEKAIVGKLISYLAMEAEKLSEQQRESRLAPLRTLAWLPAQNDDSQWYSPSELAAVFSQPEFASQATFLDLPRPLQDKCSDLIRNLGIRVAPELHQVIAHLLHCAEHREKVNEAVYRRLSEPAWSASPAIDRLKVMACIHLGDGKYAKPMQTFRGPHAFGRYRFTLGSSWEPFSVFLNRVGANRVASGLDAVDVLVEIGTSPESRGQVLTDQDAAVVHACWRQILAEWESPNLPDAVSRLRSVPCILDRTGMLAQPTYLFFDDRPDLAGFFDNLGQSLIALPERPEAMVGAGVRRLGDLIEVILESQEDQEENYFLAERVAERMGQLKRVAAASGTTNSPNSRWDALGKVRFHTASAIVVRYRFTGLDRHILTSSRSIPAVYLDDLNDLLVTPNREAPIWPWPSVARELAALVFPELSPARVAMGFLQALEPPTSEVADASLDALGIPRLQHSVDESPAPTPSIEVDLEPSRPDDPTPPMPGPEAPRPPVTVQRPGPGPFLHDQHDRPRKRRGRYATYVETVVEPRQQSPEETERRKVTGEAGIDRVKADEEDAGHTVRLMPHENEGYDIEIVEHDGSVGRFIEVKSISAMWKFDDVRLTAPEFRKAQLEGDRYWLYVVERPQSDQFRIYKIQNPANRTDSFFFDAGWIQVAESPAPED